MCFIGAVVGKTSLLARLQGQEFSPDYKATIGADILEGTLSLPLSSELLSEPPEPTQRTKTSKIKYWNTAGQKRFKALNQTFFLGTDILFLCFDPLNEQSLDRLNDELQLIAQPYITILVETRVDRVQEQDADSVYKPIAEQTIAEFKRKHDISYHFTTSAKTGQGIEEINNFLSELYEAAYKEHLANKGERIAQWQAEHELKYPVNQDPEDQDLDDANEDKQGFNAAFLLNFYPFYAVGGIALIAVAIIVASTYTIPLALAGVGLLGLASFSFFKAPHGELKETQKIEADFTLSHDKAPQPSY